MWRTKYVSESALLCLEAYVKLQATSLKSRHVFAPTMRNYLNLQPKGEVNDPKSTHWLREYARRDWCGWVGGGFGG